ncbi:MAG: excinuclease ABC subunit UvrC [Clostridia bacterium]|nr:excinuclease ABC subunit UvrC [Clostridia bacterium]
MDFDINKTLQALPAEPGVYVYSDANGTVIYVGKARVLKNRVRSYFHSSDLNLKTRRLVENIASIEYIVTSNELEALLLENNLIKKYKPKYNILLKDDKGYPYLRINTKEAYPKLELARKMTFDGATYFGPYFGAGSAKAIRDIALEIYPLQTCNHDFTKKHNVRPCLKYHIDRCPAPCINPSKEAYHKNVKKIVGFLKGNEKDALEIIRQKMIKASDKLDFERAAELRDKLEKANEILNRQKIVLDKNQDIDVLGAVLKNGYGVVCSLFIRSGRLIGINTFEQQDVSYENEGELLSKYIIQHYSQGVVLPREIVTRTCFEDKDTIEELLLSTAKKPVKIVEAKRGKKFELCLMADKNAQEKFEKSQKSISFKQKRILDGLNALKEVLKLKDIPHRLECFDISHIQGTDTVASMVVFTDGIPDKKEYRRFKTHQGNNDFASMREVVFRRFTDAKNKKAGFEKLPDLIIIDGGKGQLSSAKEILTELNVNIPVISLAEKLEEIYLPDSPLPLLLPFSSPALQILQAIRDEAHRFAITFHRSLRGKNSLISRLDNIAGIGSTRKKALLRAFSTVSKISQASIEELEKVKSMNKSSAEAVYNYFHSEEN